MAPTAVATSYSTTGTVSSPLDLDNVKGEHQTVNVSGSRRTVVSPKVKATLTSLTVHNSGTLKRINSVVIPIVYSEKFYKDVLAPELDDINKLIYYGDIPVGALCCRIENKGVPEPTLVILTLAVLAPYRSFGLGRALLTNALRCAIHPTAPPPPVPSSTHTNTRGSLTAVPPRKKVNRAMAHVQVGNDAAKKFYEGLGFKEDKVVENYYSKMEPKAATLMVCDDITSALGEQPNGTA